MGLVDKKILLIISSGIAAYKTPDLVRKLRKKGATVRCILTQNAEKLVTPMALAAVSDEAVFTETFALTEEGKIRHIDASRTADMILVAPATANILAKMAHGLADDLASTALLAADKPVYVAPAMNTQMWDHPATQANCMTLRERGIRFIDPECGELACGEVGAGRMADPATIAACLDSYSESESIGDMKGVSVLVTAGGTVEPIDPVRVIANRSSGRQGYAIAAAFAAKGANVTLVSGQATVAPPTGVSFIQVATAKEMLAACQNVVAEKSIDVGVFAAAVADYRVDKPVTEKIKKKGDAPLSLSLVPNPDVVATLAADPDNRPKLVVGFAAETNDLLENAAKKRAQKGMDWILANDVSPEKGVFGGAENDVHLITDAGEESFGKQSKEAVANRLLERVAAFLR